MPQIILAPRAQRDLQRLRDYLEQRDAAAAQRMAATLLRALDRLALFPHLGRPIGVAGIRLLSVPFGSTGYKLRYRYRVEEDNVIVLSVYHGREDDSSA